MIRLENVSKAYRAGAPALNGVSLHIEKGEFVFVMGDSGSGKSTLIKLLLKELEPTEGKIYVDGKLINGIHHKQIPKFRRNIGVVFQDFRLLNDRNVYENIALAQRVIGMPTKTIKRRVPMMLSMVGLAAKYKSYPRQLSGGEQQRVAIARALVNEPKILLADEPTGNLDSRNTWDIMKLLDEINRRGTTVLVVTHDMEIVKAMKKRVITLQKGVVVSDDRVDGRISEPVGDSVTDRVGVPVGERVDGQADDGYLDGRADGDSDKRMGKRASSRMGGYYAGNRAEDQPGGYLAARIDERMNEREDEGEDHED